MIDKLRQCNYATCVFEIAVDDNIIENTTIEEQLELMDRKYYEEYEEYEDDELVEISSSTTFEEVLDSSIYTVEDISAYIEQLEEKMPDIDIGLNDVIPAYQKVKKSNKNN